MFKINNVSQQRYIYVYICRVAMYLNATGMHYDHSQYVTHLAKIRKLEEILSLFCFFKQNLRSIFFSFVQKANFVNLYSDVYVSVSVPDHANASKLRQSAT